MALGQIKCACLLSLRTSLVLHSDEKFSYGLEIV
jgi:hypothetical protein